MSLRKSSYHINTAVKVLLGACAAVSIITTIGIIYVLLSESIPFFKEVPVFDFLFGTRWAPLLEPKAFGVLPLVTGTMMISVGAGLIAIPLGLMSAIYLSEYASKRSRNFLKPILEILAGIPTIVYGYFALTFITPVLQKIFPATESFNALSGAIVVGIMILPMIASLCDDAFTSIPSSIKEGAYALGTTSFEVIKGVLIPYSLSRVLATFILAISRAIGETMAVTLAAGANPNFSFNPLGSVQTMTAYIVQVSLGDTPHGGIEYMTCFAVGLLLFVMTLMMNMLGQWVLQKYKVKK
jgi:phosphate transport system permease protein